MKIYLTNSQIESYQGITITDSIIDSHNISHLRKRFDLSAVKLDTLNNDLIFAGGFKADKSDLEEEPLIDYSDVESFDLNNGKLLLNLEGAKKLSKLKYHGFGKQFVLFINDKPIINGYFFPTIYSYHCSTYHYPYMPNEDWKTLELLYGKELKEVDLKKKLGIE